MLFSKKNNKKSKKQEGAELCPLWKILYFQINLHGTPVLAEKVSLKHKNRSILKFKCLGCHDYHSV